MEVDAGTTSWASSSANLLRLRVSGAAAGTKSEVELMVRHTPDPRQVYFFTKAFFVSMFDCFAGTTCACTR